MVRAEQRHVCEGCGEAYDLRSSAQHCEARHEIADLAEELRDADVVGPLHETYGAVTEFLELTLEHGHARFGTRECPDCGARVHELWEQCHECRAPVSDGLDGDELLRCGDCGSTAIHFMEKSGNHRKYGARCADCESYVAHFGGYVSLRSPGGETAGEWTELDLES